MALKPVLKTKVDELFLRWLSDPDMQVSLRESLQQIARGEAVSAVAYRQSGLSRSSASRGGNNSLVTSTSPKLPSPRSPRRPLQTKKQNHGIPDSSARPVTHKDKDLPSTNHVSPEGGAKPSPDSPAVPVASELVGAKKVKDADKQGRCGGLDAQKAHGEVKVPEVPEVKSSPVSTKVTDNNNKENKPKKRVGSASATSTSPTATTTTPGTVQSGGNGVGTHQVSPHGQLLHHGSRPGSVHIKPFYFPHGEPPGGSEMMEEILKKVHQEFAGLEGGKAYKQQMGAITKACGIPVYWKILLFRAAGGTSEGYITYQSLSLLLKKLLQSCHDDSSRFMRLAAKPGAALLEFDDFEPLIQDVVETHPGLTFLQDAPEFHSRYVTTVISRIFFCVNRSWSGKISLPELRRSNFLQTLGRLEDEEDINQVKDFFSYEHFYVIYCKFWELDKDHDLYIDKQDLSRHNDHALNARLIDRIFSGAVTRGQDFQEGRMSYREFVWFLLAEEDKKHPTSIEYWFRCMDLDGDGVISMYEMEYFHEEQMNKMETLGIERLPFEDTVCQMMDMVCPRAQGRITLRDLKSCKMTSIFFDTFFNLDKFLEHEQRDPFANARDPNAEAVEVSDWNRYAEEEYDILVADEGNNDMEDGNYEDDFEPGDEDELLREEMLRLADTAPAQRKPGVTSGQSLTAEDIYDFSGTSNLGY